ncbi:MAG TPA: hypothetical protein VFV34_17525 [Blastocatellia bacterium]|nr:hypothetical protein [Blastocatellia bacterium]
MQRKITFLSLAAIALGLMAVSVPAQQPSSGSSPSNGSSPSTSSGRSDGVQTGPYLVTSSFEIGLRGVSVDGNANKYRSDLNYQPGVRLFDSSFLMKSDTASGGPFDTLLFNTSGWGADPNGYARFNAEKFGWYRFDVNLRRVDYFNSLTNLALNQHISNLEHKMGDFDLTILPQNDRIRFNVGYSFDRGDGDSLTTYDYQRDEYPVLYPQRTEANEYRFGVDAKVGIVDLSFLQGFRYFKDDSAYSISGRNIGNNPTNTSVLDSFHRDLPTRGSIPYTLFNIHTFIAKRVDIAGRFAYQSATTHFQLSELASGVDGSGNRIVSDNWVGTGDSKRPNVMGDLGVTVFVTDKMRISDTVRANVFHIDGGLLLEEDLSRTRTSAGGTVVVPSPTPDTLWFRNTDYRVASNLIEVDYEFHPRFSAHFGYRYTDRHVEEGASNITAGLPAPAGATEIFDNRTNSYIVGFKARPLNYWTIYFDTETGAADNVFTRTANYDFTNFRFRTRVAPSSKLAFNFSLVTRDNTNPALADPITQKRFGADINTRIYTGTADWTPYTKFSLSTGYTHTQVTSDADIVFFANSVRTTGLSRYFLRDNFAFINTWFELHPRATLYAAYRINHDGGQGDRVSSPTVFVGSYPQQFQTPEVRLAVKLHNRVDWNVGYQYFSFQEKFGNSQWYQTHLPYTSLRFYLNRKD